MSTFEEDESIKVTLVGVTKLQERSPAKNSNTAYSISDSESDAQEHWEENVRELKSLVVLVLCPLVGRIIGRRVAHSLWLRYMYFRYDKIQARLPMPISVAFVCLGNICRSPMAAAIFAKYVDDEGLGESILVDSFGTAAYHVGEKADCRSIKVCRENGVPINHKAKQIDSQAFTQFDYILAMDKHNLSTLELMAPAATKARVMLFGEFRTLSEYGRIVEDPYYGDDDGFEKIFDQMRDFSKGLLAHLRKNHSLD